MFISAGRDAYVFIGCCIQSGKGNDISLQTYTGNELPALNFFAVQFSEFLLSSLFFQYYEYEILLRFVFYRFTRGTNHFIQFLFSTVCCCYLSFIFIPSLSWLINVSPDKNKQPHHVTTNLY